MLREARRFEPNVIYERRFLPKISAAVSALTGIPAIVEINGLVEDEMKMQGTVRKTVLPPAIKEYLTSQIFRWMRRVVTVTAGLAREMGKRHAIHASRLAVIENGANTRLFRPLDKTQCRRKLGLDLESRWICFVGGLYRWHGVDTLIRALPLMDAHPLPVKLLIVGDGPCKAELEALVNALGVSGRVRFAGQVPYGNVPYYLGACDLGVGSFTRERNEKIGGSTMKVYEYVACGRPAVISRIPGIGEWVEREGVGRLAKPDDPQDFALQVTEALRDTRGLEEMSSKGPAVVAREHSWAVVAEKILALCDSVVRETRTEPSRSLAGAPLADLGSDR